MSENINRVNIYTYIQQINGKKNIFYLIMIYNLILVLFFLYISYKNIYYIA